MNLKTTVFDVASYILQQKGLMSTLKLQKLVYYSQAWSLVWDDEPLFNEEIQAWRDGPVTPELFKLHARSRDIERLSKGNPVNLTQDQIDTIDAVLKAYGHLDGASLSTLSHEEKPWIDARGDLSPGDQGNSVITHEAMKAYYSAM